jgi:hypothetical protein
MQAIEAQGWLEAQREITQNENLIVKPDSVLEYTCFVSFLNVATSNTNIGGINRPFSETDAWQTTGFSLTSTDTSLSFYVAKALGPYIDSNFPHHFLGGRLTALPATKPDGMATMSNVVGGPYTCDVMAKVWEQARCQNFDAIPAQDGFRDFFWYGDEATNDPRKPPDGLLSCPAIMAAAKPPVDLGNIYITNIMSV